MRAKHRIQIRPGKHFFIIYSLLVGILLISALQLAYAQSPDDYFSTGVKASRAGNHVSAVQNFKKAERAGMRTAALYYNLAVSYYHLNRLNDAKLAFQKSSRSAKMAALSYYNLGLIAQKENDLRSAEVYFGRAEQTASTDKLRTLSRIAISNLQHEKEKPPRGIFWFEVSATNDDNALLLSTDQSIATGEEDSSSDIFLYGQYQLTGDQSKGIRLQTFIVSTQYDTHDELDLFATNIGVDYRISQETWQHIFGISSLRTDFGDTELENSTQLNYSAYGVFGERQFSFVLEHENIDAGPEYNFLNGEQNLFSAGIQNKSGRWRLRYTTEQSERDDLLSTDGEFRSFSYLRHNLDWRQKFRFSDSWSVEFYAKVSKTHYADEDLRLDGTQILRMDDRLILAGTVSKSWNSGWRAQLELRNTDNHSNLEEFSYEQTMLTVSVDKTFEF